MPDFYLKQNDTLVALQATLKGADGVATDLTGYSSVKFFMRERGGAVKVDGAAATVVTAASGIVKYVWTADDTDTAGEFEGEFQVTFGDGTILTYPNGPGETGYIDILITDDIGS